MIFMTALSMLLGSQGKNKFQLQQEILNVTGNNPENVQHGGYGYRVWTKEGESIHEFCAAMNMTVGNTSEIFSLSHLKTQVDYCLVRRNQRKFSKGIKVLPS